MDSSSFRDTECRDTGQRLLGTRIHELILVDQMVSLISDLHLRPEEEEKLAALDRFLEAVPPDSILVVMGDLFDFWVGYKQALVPSWRPILDRFGALHQRGIHSFYLWGNRDYQLDAHFERQVHGTVVPGGLRLVRPSGHSLLCLHGDELCLNDKSYQTAKKRLRSWPLRFLAHHLPISLGMKAATKARTKSQEVISGSFREDLQPSRRALRAIQESGTQTLLFGHIHTAGSGPLDADSGSGSYHVLPAFEPDYPGSASFGRDGDLLLLRDGETIPWPGPVASSP